MRQNLNADHFATAVKYHYGQFPPQNLDYKRLVKPLGEARDMLARYDQNLQKMHNSGLLLAPLQRQEAVVSSRMEGTVSTLDEILQYESDKNIDENTARNEVVEVHAYWRAITQAEADMNEGYPLSDRLIRATHKALMEHSWRGTNKAAGTYKTKQNYLMDKITGTIRFIPIEPVHLGSGMEALFHYIADEREDILIRTALAHIEFEALHPFEDGNGRVGRMVIPLMLWKYGAISAPHFYISAFFENYRDEYIDHMRSASAQGDWTGWCAFFLKAIAEQADNNLAITKAIDNLYANMSDIFRDRLATKWAKDVLDFMMETPIFLSRQLASHNGIGVSNATRYISQLVDAGYLITARHPSGRRPGLYKFEPLLKIIRG